VSNPLFLNLESSSAPLKVSVDSILVLGGALVGYALFLFLTYKEGNLRDFYKNLLQASFLAKGTLFGWIIPSVILIAWYLPQTLVFSLFSVYGKALEIVSMVVAGLFGGLAWGGMSKAMKSATMFTLFFMSGTMGEIFIEFSTSFGNSIYPVYSLSQIAYTGYTMWAISVIPVTYFSVKLLKDLGLF
jgi:Protein of unknown function (DUF1404).